MARTQLTYNKKGFDIVGNFTGKGFDRTGEIWVKLHGCENYQYYGVIYKGLTSPCGSARQAETWTPKKNGSGEDFKMTWYDAAIKLQRNYNEAQANAPETEKLSAWELA